jgi:hypothetical protein
MSLVVDHVIVCLTDLNDAVAAFEGAHGVTSVEGGRHEGHGTANRLVPLGDDYVELVAVVDRGEAADRPFGAWVAEQSRRDGADGIALRTDDIEAECGRLGIETVAMSRPAHTGEMLHWRVAGIEQTIRLGLPFFIQWDVDPRRFPGRIPVVHPGGDLALDDVEVSGDIALLRSWTGNVPGLRVTEGVPGTRFRLRSRDL